MFPNIAAMRRSSSCAGRLFMRAVVSLLSLSPWIPAFCQDAQQAAPAQAIELPAISVTTAPPSKPTNQASGNSVVVSPTTLPTPSEQSASSTTVITAADIASQQFRTVPDALAAVPGLNVVQTGGPGGQTSVFIRGTNSNHVKVLIDGIDVSDPSNPNAIVRFRPAVDRRHRAHRSPARSAKRPIRLGRHRRRDFDHDQKRRRAAEGDSNCGRRIVRNI